MATATITSEQIAEFAAYLRREEKAEGTIEKYERYARKFAGFVGDSPLTKELAVKNCPKQRTIFTFCRIIS